MTPSLPANQSRWVWAALCVTVVLSGCGTTISSKTQTADLPLALPICNYSISAKTGPEDDLKKIIEMDINSSCPEGYAKVEHGCISEGIGVVKVGDKMGLDSMLVDDLFEKHAQCFAAQIEAKKSHDQLQRSP